MAHSLIRAGKYGGQKQCFVANAGCNPTWEATEECDLRRTNDHESTEPLLSKLYSEEQPKTRIKRNTRIAAFFTLVIKRHIGPKRSARSPITCMVRGLFLCTSLVVAMGVGAQTVYKSVGPDGKVVYGDSPPTEGRLDRKMKFDKLRASPLRPPTRAPAQQLGRSATAVTPVTGSVVLYSASWCGYCKAAKAYLGARGIAYREMDVVTDAGQAAYVQAGGRNGVPLLVAGGQRVERFSPAAYDAVFQVRR